MARSLALVILCAALAAADSVTCPCSSVASCGSGSMNGWCGECGPGGELTAADCREMNDECSGEFTCVGCNAGTTCPTPVTPTSSVTCQCSALSGADECDGSDHACHKIHEKCEYSGNSRCSRSSSNGRAMCSGTITCVCPAGVNTTCPGGPAPTPGPDGCTVVSDDPPPAPPAAASTRDVFVALFAYLVAAVAFLVAIGSMMAACGRASPQPQTGPVPASVAGNGLTGLPKLLNKVTGYVREDGTLAYTGWWAYARGRHDLAGICTCCACCRAAAPAGGSAPSRDLRVLELLFKLGIGFSAALVFSSADPNVNYYSRQCPGSSEQTLTQGNPSIDTVVWPAGVATAIVTKAFAFVATALVAFGRGSPRAATAFGVIIPAAAVGAALVARARLDGDPSSRIYFSVFVSSTILGWLESLLVSGPIAYAVSSAVIGAAPVSKVTPAYVSLNRGA